MRRQELRSPLRPGSLCEWIGPTLVFFPKYGSKYRHGVVIVSFNTQSIIPAAKGAPWDQQTFWRMARILMPRCGMPEFKIDWQCHLTAGIHEPEVSLWLLYKLKS